ncbi:MAG: UDP-glucose/iron transport system permease protein [Actinomycetota bacterium]|nr:UDP-glucose/iron transport system permease protein [Actinomycetota bacterium]
MTDAVTHVGIAVLLVVVAVVVSRGQHLRLEGDLVVATVRALIQLSAVAAIIHLIFSSLGLSAAALVVMLGAASWTAGHRLKGIPGGPVLALTAISVAAGTALVVLFVGRVFPLTPQYVIPIAGMLIGNCMTAVSVSGVRFKEELVDKSLELEARLALGLRAKQALTTYTRRATSIALIPTIDATKNVGLILLPGAFVGTILGGGSPFRAAQIQLIVLFMLLGAVSLASMTTTILVARVFIGPGERVVLPEQVRP